MTIKAVGKLVPEWFTPEDQEKEDSPARFKIKALNGIEKAEAMNNLRIEGDKMHLNFQGVLSVLKNGLLDWEEISDEKGPVNYSYDNLNVLPGEYHMQVAKAILDKSEVSEETKKKPE